MGGLLDKPGKKWDACPGLTLTQINGSVTLDALQQVLTTNPDVFPSFFGEGQCGYQGWGDASRKNA